MLELQHHDVVGITEILMSTNTEDGGTAFPCHTIAMHEGMTLRDYFAAKAMLFYFAGPEAKVISKNPDAIARWCYVMADCMLKARGE
jgi:hypothetical protein